MDAFLTSAVVAAFVAALFSVLTSERRIAAENVIQERKNWRDEVRELSSKVYEALSRPDATAMTCGLTGVAWPWRAAPHDDRENILRNLGAQFRFLLNPHDDMDQAILKLIAPPYGITRAEEFSNRVQLLLKHDWERAKREASLRRWLCEREPQRVAYEQFEPGHAHVYREWRWFALFAALLGAVGVELLLLGGVGIPWIQLDQVKGTWWRTVEGPSWKFVGGALLVGGAVLLYFESKTRRSG